MNKIYTGDIDDIRKEILNLKENFAIGKNISESYSYLSNINALNGLHKCLTGEEVINFKRLCGVNKHLTQQASNFGRKHQDAFSMIFLDNKELIKFISCHAHNIIVDKYVREDSSMIVDLFTEEEMYEIVIDFLKKYHPEDLELFNEMIRNRRIVKVDGLNEFEDRLLGQCSHIYKGLPFIITQESAITLDSIRCLIHEFGHASDMSDLNKKFSINQMSKYFFLSGKTEVLSMLYERQLIDFFIEEKINLSFIPYLLEDYYEIIEKSLLECYFFSLLDDWFIYKSNYLKCDEGIFDYINNKELREVFSSDIDINTIDMRSSFRYALGGLVSLILIEKLKTDKDQGNKILTNFMNNRCRSFDDVFIEQLEYCDGDLERIVSKDHQLVKKYINFDC